LTKLRKRIPGASDAAKAEIGFGRGLKDDEQDAAIKRRFTPEFRNRLDAVVSFAALVPEDIAKVVDKFVIQLEAQLADRKIEFEVSKGANLWLANKGYDKRYGARPLGRTIQEYVKKPLADEILFGKLKSGGLVKVERPTRAQTDRGCLRYGRGSGLSIYLSII